MRWPNIGSLGEVILRCGIRNAGITLRAVGRSVRALATVEPARINAIIKVPFIGDTPFEVNLRQVVAIVRSIQNWPAKMLVGQIDWRRVARILSTFVFFAFLIRVSSWIKLLRSKQRPFPVAFDFLCKAPHNSNLIVTSNFAAAVL